MLPQAYILYYIKGGQWHKEYYGPIICNTLEEAVEAVPRLSVFVKEKKYHNKCY